MVVAVEALVEQSRRAEATVRYRASRAVGEPNVVRFFEQYEDEAAARDHRESEAYRRFNERLLELVEGESETVQAAIGDDPGTHRFSAEEAAESVS